MTYIVTRTDPDELYHYGVKGMKWGRRRFRGHAGPGHYLTRKRQLAGDKRDLEALNKGEHLSLGLTKKRQAAYDARDKRLIEKRIAKNEKYITDKRANYYGPNKSKFRASNGMVVGAPKNRTVGALRKFEASKVGGSMIYGTSKLNTAIYGRGKNKKMWENIERGIARELQAVRESERAHKQANKRRKGR